MLLLLPLLLHRMTGEAIAFFGPMEYRGKLLLAQTKWYPWQILFCTFAIWRERTWKEDEGLMLRRRRHESENVWTKRRREKRHAALYGWMIVCMHASSSLLLTIIIIIISKSFPKTLFHVYMYQALKQVIVRSELLSVSYTTAFFHFYEDECSGSLSFLSSVCHAWACGLTWYSSWLK